jgi:hypothetical protein
MEKFKTKSSLPRCDRITVVADSEHMGEKVPFCTVEKKKDDNSDDDKDRKKKPGYFTAYPNVTLFILK